jgi:hypothetical protein
MRFNKIIRNLLNEEKEKKIATTVDIGGQEETGGFCEHNPAINRFAFENPVHMFMVLAFVLFTMQKPWSVVIEGFIEFLTWWFTDAASKLQENPSREDITYPKDASYAKYVNRYGPNNNYLIGFWNNRVQIFENLKALKEGRGSLDKEAKIIITNLADTFDNKHQTPEEEEIHNSILLSLEDTLNSPEYLVFRYLCSLDGLGAPKAGFVTQLILGKMGCVDSVNTNIYKSFFPSATWDPKTSSARSVGIEKSGKMQGTFSNPAERSMAGYAYFLKYLQHMYSNDEHIRDVSRMMWDDWCEIIARKMIYATNKGGLKDQQIFIKHITGGGASIDPYQHDVRSGHGIDKWKKEAPSGFRVSREHETSLTGARDIAAQARSQFPESTQFMNDEEQIFEMYKKIYKEEKESKKKYSKNSSKEEPIKQTGEYLEITVPDKI